MRISTVPCGLTSVCDLRSAGTAAVASAARDGRATLEDVERRCNVENLATILKDLEAREVLVQESGGYRILVRLYHDWLCRRTA